jgi:F-type H+-transporting ATPase subunit a
MGEILTLSAGTWFAQFFSALKQKLIEAIQVGDIGEEIRQSILPWKGYFSMGNYQVLLTDAVIVTWVSVIPFILFWVWIASRREKIPTGRQMVSESIVKLFMDLCRNNGLSEKQAEQVAPMIGSICFFLIACNLSSVFKIPPPAKNIAFPIAMAFFTITYVLVTAIRFVGIRGFWRSLISPTPVMLPFKILDYLIKPVSLSLRLFGNIFGAFILMEFLYIIVPIIVPGVFGLWFDIADGLLQAVIFMYLTASYIGEIVESAEATKDDKEKKITVAAS